MSRLRRLGSWSWSQIPNRYVGNLLSWLGLLYVPLDNDLPLREAVYKAWRRPLSGKVGWLHVFGAMALFLTSVLVVTGILLSFHYEPSQEAARDSVLFMMRDVTGGWLVRGVHAWAAELLVVLVFIHVARTFFARAYRSPRAANWIVGLLILPVIMLFEFTGEILPWDSFAYWTSVRANELGGDIPIWGAMMSHLAAGPDLSNVTLVRYFALHTIILPWILFFLLAYHLRLVRRLGIAPPMLRRSGAGRADLAILVVLRSESGTAQVERVRAILEDAGATSHAVRGTQRIMLHSEGCTRGAVDTLALDPDVEEIVPLSKAARGTAFFPRHFIRVVSALLLTTGALLLLAAFATPVVRGAADPFLRPDAIKVKWYFLWFEELRGLLPAGLAFVAPLLFVVLPLAGLLWPLIDRCGADGPRHRWLAPVVGIAVLVVFGILTFMGARS